MTILCFTIRFLHLDQHGRGDGGEPEWPPSPLRLFQALVAAAAGRWNERQHLAFAGPSLKWLESLDSPIIVAAQGITSKVRTQFYVPDNTADLLVPQFKKGIVEATPKRTEKVVCPTHLKGEEVHFLYPLQDGLCPHFETLQAASRSVTHLGWGIDMVVGNSKLLTKTETSQLKGEIWRPVTDPSGFPFRTPIPGTLDDLSAKHQTTLARLDKEGFKPVSPLSIFRITYYHRDTDPISSPFLAFSLLKPDASGFRTFDTIRRTRDVAGMVRCATAKAAKLVGWSENRINSFVHGHGTEKSGQSTSDDRLMFLPIPSITPLKVDSIRRVLVVAPRGFPTRELQNIMGGLELIPEHSDAPLAMLSLIPKSDRTVENYSKASSTWSTVTPVLLPGYDDPGHLRKKLNSTSDSTTQKRLLEKLNSRVLQLLQKAFIQAGFTKDLVDQIQFDWQSVGFRAGVDLASKYVRPKNLEKFPAYHVQVRFPTPFQGPLAIGAGRYRGFGLFARED